MYNNNSLWAPKCNIIYLYSLLQTNILYYRKIHSQDFERRCCCIIRWFKMYHWTEYLIIITGIWYREEHGAKLVVDLVPAVVLRDDMMTSSNGTKSASLALCAGNYQVIGEFSVQKSVTRSFDIIFDLRLNKCLSKQSWGWWFKTPSCSLWRHCNVICHSRQCIVMCTVFKYDNSPEHFPLTRFIEGAISHNHLCVLCHQNLYCQTACVRLCSLAKKN